MKVLSINAGSSSLKFTLFEMPEEKELISGVFERIGLNESFYSIEINGIKEKKEEVIKNHKEAFEILIKELLNNKIIENLNEVEGIGHRVAQGGAYFDKTVLASKENIEICEKLSHLAPLHNPPQIAALKSAQEVFKNAAHTLVFDTAFHQTIEIENFLYAVPYEWYTKYNVRRYGFHGTSHKYINLKANKLLNKEDTKIISCHIGNGASISAIKNNKCINTSMGFTPNAGLMMGTRCGDIDATIVTYMMRETGINAEMVDDILNKESGLLGVSGVSSDSRDIEDGIKNGDKRCILAQNIYVSKIVDYIAKYYVQLGGCDAIVFTAGVGENLPDVRKAVCEKLNVLGIKIDLDKNNVRGKETLISKDDSKVKVYIIPTNEELMIAKDTFDLVK